MQETRKLGNVRFIWFIANTQGTIKVSSSTIARIDVDVTNYTYLSIEFGKTVDFSK